MRELTVEDNPERAGEQCISVAGERLVDSRFSTNGPDGSLARYWGTALRRIESLSILNLLCTDSVEIELPDLEKDLLDWEFAYCQFNRPWNEEGTLTSDTVPCAFRIEYDLEFWDRPYSIANLATAIEVVLAANPELQFRYWQYDTNTCIEGFGVSVLASLNRRVGEIIALRADLSRLRKLVKDELAAEEDRRTLVRRFSFPASIRSACEQYLIYFVQFLRDLGIEADVEMKEEAAQVLFSVAPKDTAEGLERIREALEVYLQLPIRPEVMVSESHHDVAVSQLQANILHLQSQITLAKAILQVKDATIAAREEQISTLRERIDMREFLPRRAAIPTPDTEPIIDGVVAVKQYDFKFLQVNFPELLRKLKRKW